MDITSTIEHQAGWFPNTIVIYFRIYESMLFIVEPESGLKLLI